MQPSIGSPELAVTVIMSALQLEILKAVYDSPT